MTKHFTILILSALIPLIIFIMFALSTDHDKAKQLLIDNGFTHVEITGYNYFVCSRDGVYSTDFQARTSNGTLVKGTVCRGVFKGSIIRFD